MSVALTRPPRERGVGAVALEPEKLLVQRADDSLDAPAVVAAEFLDPRDLVLVTARGEVDGLAEALASAVVDDEDDGVSLSTER